MLPRLASTSATSALNYPWRLHLCYIVLITGELGGEADRAAPLANYACISAYYDVFAVRLLSGILYTCGDYTESSLARLVEDTWAVHVLSDSYRAGRYYFSFAAEYGAAEVAARTGTTEASTAAGWEEGEKALSAPLCPAGTAYGNVAHS